MTDPRDIRTILRDADPAASRKLSPADAARMRAEIVAAAAEKRTPWPWKVGLQLVTASTIVAIVAILMSRRAIEPTVPMRTAEAPREAPKPAAPARIEEAPPIVIRRTVRPHRAPSAPSAQAATRILFTAPEGTQILWFVGPPTTSEETS